MEPRPLSDDTLATADLAEPHLELVPALDDPDAPEPEAEAEEDGPAPRTSSKRSRPPPSLRIL